MNQDNEQTAEQKPVVYPEVGSAYGQGWRQMWKYILELLLIIIIAFLLSIPSSGLSVSSELEGVGAFFLFIFSLAYLVLVQWPVEYGVAFAALKAVRGEKLEVKDKTLLIYHDFYHEIYNEVEEQREKVLCDLENWLENHTAVSAEPNLVKFSYS